MKDSMKKQVNEEIETLVRTRLLELLAGDKVDDKILAVAMRFLKEFRIETIDDLARETKMDEIRDSLPFKTGTS